MFKRYKFFKVKKALIILSSIFIQLAIGQSQFKWETIDSTANSKDQLYSLTKTFIAEKWKSANDVIQNDDKEGGVIILKGLTQTYVYKYAMNPHEFVYQYTMKFYFKDKKYRVQIEDVKCYSHYVMANKWNCLDPEENVTQKVEGMPAEKFNEMMAELKKELSAIMLSYNNYIYTSKEKSDW